LQAAAVSAAHLDLHILGHFAIAALDAVKAW
jgi:hypothetical protein